MCKFFMNKRPLWKSAGIIGIQGCTFAESMVY